MKRKCNLIRDIEDLETKENKMRKIYSIFTNKFKDVISIL